MIKVPFDRWWQAMEEGSFPGVEGSSSIPVMDDAVMAGNGTIGLELVEQLDEIDAVLSPGAAAGSRPESRARSRALARDEGVRVRARDGRAAVGRARNAGEPVQVDYRRRSSTERAQERCCAPMWERARPLLTGAFALSLDETAAAVRLLAERARIVAEGAGALAVAAALAGRAGEGRIVCIVSGGNIDAARLATILEGRTPS